MLADEPPKSEPVLLPVVPAELIGGFEILPYDGDNWQDHPTTWPRSTNTDPMHLSIISLYCQYEFAEGQQVAMHRLR